MIQPVYPGYFADPFVWKHGGMYYAIGTGLIESLSAAGQGSEALTVDGRPGVFLILKSADLREWTPAGSALCTLDPEFGDAYWAPEVAYADGLFYLYYSVGRGDKGHHLRVAVSRTPEGPFEDTGTRLTDPFATPFAIDASPFQDDDGQWYLFYARDFLDEREGRIGTGVAAGRLTNMTALTGSECVVARARFDWQRFAANRVMYGGRWDWHTIEGPCVRKRDGRYYCLYSAGRWENETYGVDFVTAEHPLGPYGRPDAEGGPRVLRTIPGILVGPGHNSVIEGPDGIDRIVFHAWDAAMTARRMFIARLEWTEEGPRAMVDAN